jgi:membrane protein involved in colicin uptake
VKLLITQEDIELAVRAFVSSQGLARDIANVEFNRTGRGGQAIEAEIVFAPVNGNVPTQFTRELDQPIEAPKAEEEVVEVEETAEEATVDFVVDAAAQSIFGS